MRCSELAERLDLLNELELQRRELEAHIEAIKDCIKAEMSVRNTDEIIIGNRTVSWKSYTVHRFDTSFFKAEHNDLYQQYAKASEVKRFVLH